MFLPLHETSGQMPLGQIQFPGLEKVVFQADFIPFAGCMVVALIMLASVARWLVRGSLLRRVKALDAKFMASFRSSAHALALFQNGEVVEESPRSALYTNASRELAFHLLGTDSVDKGFAMRLRAAGRVTPSQWQAAQRAARRSVEESARWFRAGLTGSGVKSLPGLGLLFMLLALMEHAASGALDATTAASSLRPFVLALLLHAIGSAWHRGLLQRVDDLVADLEDFASELGMLFERSFVDHRHPIEALPSLGTMGMADGPTFSLPPSEPTKAMAH